MANPLASFFSPVQGMQETLVANSEAAVAQAEAARLGVKAEAAEARGSEVAMAAIIKINQQNDLLFEAKKVLHGQVALREALKAALKEVAPGHPLNDSDTRQKIVEEAMEKTGYMHSEVGK
jgi:hypothetical protein